MVVCPHLSEHRFLGSVTSLITQLINVPEGVSIFKPGRPLRSFYSFIICYSAVGRPAR
jgi:hypothetical protein